MWAVRAFCGLSACLVPTAARTAVVAPRAGRVVPAAPPGAGHTPSLRPGTAPRGLRETSPWDGLGPSLQGQPSAGLVRGPAPSLVRTPQVRNRHPAYAASSPGPDVRPAGLPRPAVSPLVLGASQPRG